MRYIIATLSNGYCGCDVEEYWAFPDDFTDRDIEEYLYEGIIDYADSYRPCNLEFEDEQDEQYYYEDCTVNCREATPEEIEEIGIDKFMPA